ncbi:MAG: 2,4'-dihydroxyacetophenone dioxygenase family protein [Planctomycetes bacterium]|jgi:quercetin dioxygenase-like cupin family protein|nr:2,4'-dihydroxyacetophenone dioxygenase family protein [Planctomycetota bacterium]
MSATPATPFAEIARHVGVDQVPWVPNPRFPGAELRLLQADTRQGITVMAGRLAGDMEVGTHRHTGAVHMFTLAGAWKYHEHEFVNRAGSYLYEPPGSVHTLYVLPNDERTETLSVVYGKTEYLDADGVVTHVSSAETNLQAYYEACELAGVPRPGGILLHT